MKKYKLLKDLPFFGAGTILKDTIDEDGQLTITQTNGDAAILIDNSVSRSFKRMRDSAPGIFDEWFEEVKTIELPEDIKYALHAWLDAQDETFSGLIYEAYASTIEFWALGVSIEFSADEIDGLEDGREYTLKELGLEV